MKKFMMLSLLSISSGMWASPVWRTTQESDGRWHAEIVDGREMVARALGGNPTEKHMLKRLCDPQENKVYASYNAQLLLQQCPEENARRFLIKEIFGSQLRRSVAKVVVKEQCTHLCIAAWLQCGFELTDFSLTADQRAALGKLPDIMSHLRVSDALPIPGVQSEVATVDENSPLHLLAAAACMRSQSWTAGQEADADCNVVKNKTGIFHGIVPYHHSSL